MYHPLDLEITRMKRIRLSLEVPPFVNMLHLQPNGLIAIELQM